MTRRERLERRVEQRQAKLARLFCVLNFLCFSLVKHWTLRLHGVYCRYGQRQTNRETER